ncbi:MAG: transglycosylase SLT domain-containing protein [Rhodobacteraceae bacterium]|nr:transglycosylase SLT domain-containing protein [Paracoccaceae bacterium]
MHSITRFFPAVFAAFALAGPLCAQTGGGPLADALQLADQQNWDAAEASARQAGPLALDIIEWDRLRSGDGAFSDYVTFLRRRPDWPGLPYMRLKGEATINVNVPNAEVLAFFAADLPRTAAGSLAFQTALQAAGKTKEATAEARRAWLSLSYAADEQAAELAAFGPALAGLNDKRLDALLWRGRTTEAGRMLPLASPGAQALGAARLALQTEAKGVDALVAAVPATLQTDPGLLHDRFAYRFAKGNLDGAADLLLQSSGSAKTLGDPGAWANERARLARREMLGGDPKRAYQLAANDHLTAGGDYADLEFLAGYIALQKLHDPKAALAHFRNLGAGVTTPISLSRAAYWEGRAAEAMGDAKAAKAAYDNGAQYQTAFYGLLSAEKAGLPLDPLLLGNDLPDWHGAAFLQSSVIQAALLLQKAGDRMLAKRFFLHVAEGLDATGLGQLASLALSLNEPNIGVMIAKKGADRNIILPLAYFPLTALAKAQLPVSTDLALAIARRESEFDETVISPAGALGLMQVMPDTARRMASAVGVSYDKARLTQDGDYNAQLGSAYLAKLIDQFGPALTLVAAGYNAGPNRATAWITQLGDPRAPGVDPIDWIESVPYTETRDYIMRVAESYEIYRAKLAGKSLPIRLTAELKGQ